MSDDLFVEGYPVAGLWLRLPNPHAPTAIGVDGIQAVGIFKELEPWRWIVQSGMRVYSKSLGFFAIMMPGFQISGWDITDTTYKDLSEVLAWWNGAGGAQLRDRISQMTKSARMTQHGMSNDGHPFTWWPGRLN